MLGAGLIRNDGGDAMHQVGVPGGGQTDGLRKDGGYASAPDAVQGFVPPVVGGHAQPLDGRSVIDHLRDFFLQGHTGNQSVYALLDRERGV
jgi:hypothetical protein